MIVKDQEINIGKCLDSVKEYVDEIIVLDTGSKDNTKKIALEKGAKVFDFKWIDDFSAARNESLKKASSDWILILDPDEVISKKDLERLKELIDKNPKAMGFTLLQRNYTDKANVFGWKPNSGKYEEETGEGYFDNSLVRLFRNNIGIEFRNKIHEIVEPSIDEKNGEIIELDIPIHHYVSYQPNQDKKTEQYLRIGLEQIKINPDKPKPYYEVGEIYLEQNNYDKALECFRKVEEIEPDYMYNYTNLGIVYFAKKDLVNALKCYQKQIDVRPSETAYINLANLLFKIGKIEKAEKIYRAVIKNNNKNIVAHINLAKLLHSANRTKDAVKVLEVCIQNTKSVDSINALAEIYYKNKNYRRVVEILENVIELNPENKSAVFINLYVNCANSCLKIGEKEKAMDILKKALSLNPSGKKFIEDMLKKIG